MDILKALWCIVFAVSGLDDGAKDVLYRIGGFDTIFKVCTDHESLLTIDFAAHVLGFCLRRWSFDNFPPIVQEHVKLASTAMFGQNPLLRTLYPLAVRDTLSGVPLEHLASLIKSGCLRGLAVDGLRMQMVLERGNTLGIFSTLLDCFRGHDSRLLDEHLDELDFFNHLGQLAQDQWVPVLVRDHVRAFLFRMYEDRWHLSDSSPIACQANSDLWQEKRFCSSNQTATQAQPDDALMMAASIILSTPRWPSLAGDAAAVQRWRDEIMQLRSLHGAPAQKFDQVFTSVFAEARYLAEHCARSAFDGGMTVAPGAVSRTFVSDDAIPGHLRAALAAYVQDLESAPGYKFNWHPNGNGQLLDLVHPAMFSVEYGRTPIARHSDRVGSTAMLPLHLLASRMRPADEPFLTRLPLLELSSQKTQWLPTEVRVESNGSVSILSPINGLNPVWHRQLYVLVAKVFERFVPLLEGLSGLVGSDFVRLSSHSGQSQNTSKAGPLSFVPPNKPPTPISLRGRNLQLFVKLTTVHLTPDRPQYAAGAWHNEGRSNEAIVASGICYYDSENVTDAKLFFRPLNSPSFFSYHPSDMPDDQWMATPKGRCIAFSNMLRHRVGNFELVDPKKPGFRRILVFFLVDPAKRIVSTAHVAPQQAWWYHVGLALTPLPPELWQDVVKHVDGTMSVDRARELRFEAFPPLPRATTALFR